MYTIIVVEDDPDVCCFMSLALSGRHTNYIVHTAASGQAFFALLEKQMPDLVLLDVQLPDTSGIVLYNLLRLRPDLKDLPVLFVTANPHLVGEAALAGPYACLAKPFAVTTLLATVNALLGPSTERDSVSA